MLDNAGDRSEEERECLAIAKAMGMLLHIAVRGDPGKLLSILGATTEHILMGIEDPDEREELTLEFLETLADHMGFRTDRAANR